LPAIVENQTANCKNGAPLDRRLAARSPGGKIAWSKSPGIDRVGDPARRLALDIAVLEPSGVRISVLGGKLFGGQKILVATINCLRASY
jgi:hypothetical protein